MTRSDLIYFHASALEDAPNRVLFVTSMWPGELPTLLRHVYPHTAPSLEALGIAVDVLSIRGYESQRAYVMAVDAIRRRRSASAYSLSHVHTGHAAASAVLAVKGPMVISYVGGDLLGNPGPGGLTLKSRLEAGVFRQLAWRAAATITKSEEMQRALPKSLRRRNNVIPNGVDLDRFAPQPRAQARQVLGWNPNEEVVLFLGDPSDPRKNVTLAQDAVADLRRSRNGVRLHLGWGVAPSEIPNLMWASDVLAFPSRSEGSPNVVKEAMAATLPIVATPVGDVRERLEGVEGCFVTGFDPEAFAGALGSALDFGRATAAREAVKPLALDAIARRVATVYDYVTRARRGAQSGPVS